MDLFDITVPLHSSLQTYPGDPPFSLELPSEETSATNPSVSRLTMTTHCGTHIDVPRHISISGNTVEDIPLSLLMGPALVVELPETEEIGRHLLENLNLCGVQRLLLKTGNCRLWQSPEFVERYTALSEDGARYLVDAGVRLVGIDYLSIETFPGEGRVHEVLLSNGIIILEGLDLSAVPAGEYELIALPLSIKGGDGAPVRAVLRDAITRRDCNSIPGTGEKLP